MTGTEVIGHVAGVAAVGLGLFALICAIASRIRRRRIAKQRLEDMRDE